MLGRVSLNKKERGLTIAVGVSIGVVLSWALFSQWHEDRGEIEQNLSGNYDSNITVLGKPLALVPPKQIQIRYPKGRVLYHAAEVNASSTIPGQDTPENAWILTVSSGRFKFVRVEQKASGDANSTGALSLYRGAEVFVWTRPSVSEDELRESLPEDQFKVIGRNTRRDCYLVQFRETSLMGLPAAIRELLGNSAIEKVEPCLIE